MSASKGKILVVDDDRLVLATLTFGLSQAGFEVIDADNGDDAILLAREHRPELALLDIRMEGLSGFDVAAYLREYLQIPFMFLSAFADEQTVAKVQALGAVAYLVKPLDIHQIVPAVEASFANRATSVKTATQEAARAIAQAPAQIAAPIPAEIPAQDAAPAAAPATAAQPLAAAQPLSDSASLAAIAVGVLMHRYSLTRAEGHSRLQKLADAEGRSVTDQALRLVEALELLASVK